MHKADDWRVTNQEQYLKGVQLVWRPYSPNKGNDHDHCEFCWVKFTVIGTPDTLTEGYATKDGYRWICKTCFDDFVSRFNWQVIS